MNLEILILLKIYCNDIFVYVGIGFDIVWLRRGNICSRVVKQVRGLYGIMGLYFSFVGYGESNVNFINGDFVF